MKNFELSTNGLKELEFHEYRVIDGGFVLLAALATAYLGIALFQAMENPERIVDGFLDSLS